MAEQRDKVLRRVRGLLAKAENAGTPEEAESFSAKAEELVAKYAIDLALLSKSAGTREKPTVRDIAMEQNYKNPKAALLTGIGAAFDVRVILVGRTRCTMVGFESDMQSVELLYTSLLLQSANALRVESAKSGLRGDDLWRWRQSFLYGFASTVKSRLMATRTRATESGEPGTALVLRDRKNEVADVFQGLFPSTRPVGGPSRHDHRGMAAGNAAGAQANLGGTGIGQNTKAAIGG